MGACFRRYRRQYRLDVEFPNDNYCMLPASSSYSFSDTDIYAYLDESESVKRLPKTESLQPPHTEESFTITSEAKVFEWKGYGLIVHVPENCLPHSLTSARLDVKICSMYLHVEHRTLRPDQPVSALYSVTVGEGRLCKPITLQIQHCASTKSIPQRMVNFLRSTDEDQPFNPILFAHESGQYCKVTVPQAQSETPSLAEYDDFSWFMIVLRHVFLPGSIHYTAQVYIKCTDKVMHFIVTMALDVCTSVGGYQMLEQYLGS